MSGTEGSLIENNYFISNGMSIHLFDSHRNVDPQQHDQRHHPRPGPRLRRRHRASRTARAHNVLENNDVSDTGDAGIVIHQGSHGNIVRGGVLVRNGDAGVIVAGLRPDRDRRRPGAPAVGRRRRAVQLEQQHRQEQRPRLQPVGRRRLGHEQPRRREQRRLALAPGRASSSATASTWWSATTSRT